MGNADGSRVKEVNTQISGQTHEYAADGTIEVSGTDIIYDAKKAANATSYSADKQQSLAGQGPTQAQIEDANRRKAEAARMDAIRSKAAFSPRGGGGDDTRVPPPRHCADLRLQGAKQVRIC